MTVPDSVTIRQPDDWHVHLRDDMMLEAVLPYTARQFARAIVMPNLPQPVVNSQRAAEYRDRILAALPAGSDFIPLMTCYLTDTTDAEDLVRGFESGVFTAAKLYPAHATTNSAHGVSTISTIRPVLERMEEAGMPLLIHGEVTDSGTDIFDREAVFIERILAPLAASLPGLKIVLEHITTAEAVRFVDQAGPNIAATITPQHLHINRNSMFEGGLRPHAYCLPVAKRETHRLALRAAAVSGSAKYFLGTDTAPHERGRKESACGCAGIFNAPFALESYLQVFEEENALDKFEAFASENGPQFYGLPLNEGVITLERSPVQVPESLEFGGLDIVPFHAGQILNWRLKTG
ncbi:MAG: dihydroorotase [Sphingomonadaceae bacterium]